MATQKTIYFNQLNGFRSYLHSDICDLSPNATYLYLYMLTEWNDFRISRAKVFQLFESDIERYTGLSESTVRRKRKELIDHGLIAYVRGVKRGAGFYQFADLSDFENLKPFEILPDDLPNRLTKKIPGHDDRETSKIPGHDDRETSKIPGHDDRETEIPGHDDRETEIPGQCDGHDDRETDSLLYRETDIENKRNLLTENYLFLEEDTETNNSKNKKMKNSFFDEIKNLWESRLSQPFPAHDKRTLNRIHSQLNNLVSKYGEKVVMETLDYITNNTWIRGESPDNNGEYYTARPEVILQDGDYIWMMGLDRRLYDPKSKKSAPGDSRPESRDAQYDAILQDDYDWFYGEGEYADEDKSDSLDGEDAAPADDSDKTADSDN